MDGRRPTLVVVGEREAIYLVIVDQSIPDPHERDQEEVDLADNAALHCFVPRLSVLGNKGGGDVSGIYMKRYVRAGYLSGDDTCSGRPSVVRVVFVV